MWGSRVVRSALRPTLSWPPVWGLPASAAGLAASAGFAASAGLAVGAPCAAGAAGAELAAGLLSAGLAGGAAADWQATLSITTINSGMPIERRTRPTRHLQGSPP